MNCEPEQVIIMTSMLQTLALVSKLVLNAGEPAYVEDPCHPTARRVLTDAGALIVPVAVDQHGPR